MPEDDPDRLVVITSLPTLEQADVTRATLQAEGIDAVILDENTASTLHMSFATYSDGIRVAIRARDVPKARQVLNLPDGEEVEPSSEADTLAAAAYRLAFFSCIFPPLLFVTFGFFLRAARAGQTHRPVDPYLYRKHLLYAFFLGVLLPAAAVAALIAWGAPIGLKW